MQPENRGNYLVKLLLFALASLLVLGSAAAAILFGPYILKAVFAPPWLTEFNQGVGLWRSDRARAEPMLNEALSKAEAAHASVADLMSLHRQYASMLYGADEWQAGNAQIAKAIAICPPSPPADSQEASELTHAYQDRGWDSHQRYVKDHTFDPGDKDQEMSVLVAEKAFGPDHEQTIYKVPTLAIIYCDMGLSDKAHAVMKRAFDAADHKPSAAETRWFVYASDARIKATEHNYDAAMQSYLQALKFAQNKYQRDRSWEQFDDGLALNRVDQEPDIKDVHSLLLQEKFDQLDARATKLLKSETPVVSGWWKLDRFHKRMLDDESNSEDDYHQLLFEIKAWLKQYPNSTDARIAMAECLTDYAWFARGSGYSDSVSQQGWKLFASRLEQAKSVLDADPRLINKNPRAFTAYARIALGQSLDKKPYLKMVDYCNHQWPSYYGIDSCATNYLLPRWYGDPHESERFIVSRADALGGPKGDELYAQLVWDRWEYYDDIFSADSPLKWSRVQSGFKQIFKDFPNDLDARIAFIKLGTAAHDTDGIRVAFEGYH